MPKKELLKRYLLFILSLCISALGVALTKSAELGVSPISSVANVLFIRYPRISMGNWLILWNCVMIAAQIAILRKDFKLRDLLQIPLSVLFGRFTDLWMAVLAGVSLTAYPARLALVFLGIAVNGFGITLAVVAAVIMNSGEALVRAITDKSGLVFGNVKIGFDVFCVALSIVMSVAMFGGRIVGTREGTVLSALLTGVFIRFYTGKVQAPIDRLLRANI